MNRRSFLRNSALALFGFTVLPPAETYQRVWRATKAPVQMITFWTQTARASYCFDQEYLRMQDMIQKPTGVPTEFFSHQTKISLQYNSI